MAVTRLDWDVLPYGSSRLTNLRWVTGNCRAGDAHTILDELGRRFHNEVEPIIVAHSWGHAVRPVRGHSFASEHAAGTAVDFNAPYHPLGRRNTFSWNKRRKIRNIVKSFDGAIRWGGDYPGRPDDMHFELMGGVRKLAQVASKIQGGSTVGSAGVSKPTVSKKPAPKPAPYKARSDASIRRICLKVTSGTKKNTTGHLVGLYQRQQWKPLSLVQDQNWGQTTDRHYRYVSQLQKALNKWKSDLPDLRVDGDHRELTVLRVREWQTRNHGGAYTGEIDGWAGPDMAKTLGIKYRN